MPAEVAAYMFTNTDPRTRLQFQIVFQCAPLLKGMKAACMLSFEESQWKELEAVLEGTEMEYQILAEKKGRRLIILFRRKELAIYLKQPEVREFLEQYGYRAEKPDLALQHLSGRIRHAFYADDNGVCKNIYGNPCHKGSFPHETGAFLGYPIEDVRSFIKWNGKNYLMSGYWKVYSHPGRAQMTFLAYDKARTCAVNEFLVGKRLGEIAMDEGFYVDNYLNFFYTHKRTFR